jgi:hypothetical protein
MSSTGWRKDSKEIFGESVEARKLIKQMKKKVYGIQE